MPREGSLRSVLERLSTTSVSGQTLAHSLRVTRAGVWKNIRALQALGFPIRSHAKNGYALETTAPFSLLSLKLKAPLANWAKPHVELSTSSTQTLAKRAAHAGMPEGHLWASEVQGQGRGRLGRVWESGFGGLWFSIVLRPQVPPSRAATIGMLAALTLAETVQGVTGVRARLKWPNDLVVPVKGGWRKVAGFLTEMAGEMDKTEWIVLGIGLNVHNRLPAALTNLATTLSQQAGSPVSREEILTDFLKRFRTHYSQWQRHGFEPFVSAYWKLYFKPNEPVELRTGQGVVKGIARCVDASGAIIVESRRKKRSLLEGDIVL